MNPVIDPVCSVLEQKISFSKPENVTTASVIECDFFYWPVYENMYSRIPESASYMFVSCDLEPVICNPDLDPFDSVCELKISKPGPVSHSKRGECSGSVVECLTRDRRAAGSSLTGVTALWSLSKTHLS